MRLFTSHTRARKPIGARHLRVDIKAEYPEGIEAFYKFVSKNYQAPRSAKGKKGRIYIEYVVEKDGTLTNFKILKDIGLGTGEEAIRVIKLSPNWIPAQKDGQVVRLRTKLPIMLYHR